MYKNLLYEFVLHLMNVIFDDWKMSTSILEC